MVFLNQLIVNRWPDRDTSNSREASNGNSNGNSWDSWTTNGSNNIDNCMIIINQLRQQEHNGQVTAEGVPAIAFIIATEETPAK
jgi:hypothetical protein